MMEDPKNNREYLKCTIESLESQWTRLNDDINRFLEKSNQKISPEHCKTILGILSQENETVNCCRRLACFLKDDKKCFCNKSSERNANATVNCDENGLEILSDASANDSGYNSIVVDCKEKTKDTVGNPDYTTLSKKTNVSINNDIKTQRLNEQQDNDVNYIKPVVDNVKATTVNFIPDKNIRYDNIMHAIQAVNERTEMTSKNVCNINEQIHDVSIENQSHDYAETVNEVTNKSNYNLKIDQDLRNINNTAALVEMLNKSTEMSIDNGNKISNLFTRKEENNTASENSNTVDEDDRDVITLMVEKDFLDDDLFNNSDDSNPLRENKQLKKINNDNNNDIKSNLNKSSTEIQNVNFQHNNGENINKAVDKIEPNLEFKSKETVDKIEYEAISNAAVTDLRESVRLDMDFDVPQRFVDENYNRDNFDRLKHSYYDITRKDENEIFSQKNDISEKFDSQCLNLENITNQKTKVDDFKNGYIRKPMILFKNVCYFNLMNKCNRPNCVFPHEIPSISSIANKLVNFSNIFLIEEYNLRKNNKIKVDYGLCFLEECTKRHLSKQVVRMAIDIIKSTNNNEPAEVNLQKDVISITLLHLNEANIDECADLLIEMKFPGGRCFCDILLENIGITDHFSEYKLAFIELTYLIIKERKAFNNKIASNILKQICKIPNESALSRALLKVMQHSNPKIFLDPMIKQFESMIEHDKDLARELMNIKCGIRKSSIDVNVTKQFAIEKSTNNQGGGNNAKNMDINHTKRTMNQKHVSSSINNRRPSTDTKEKLKKKLSQKQPVVVILKDPNYVSKKIVKRKKSVKIYPYNSWMNTEQKLHGDSVKEN